jgi:hypothetical protein
MSTKNILKIATGAAFVVALAISPFAFAQEHKHSEGFQGNDAAPPTDKTVTGEIVDMMCYVDHNAMGDEHGKMCGSKCIKAGGPVGIVENGKAYLVVGDHKPMNDQLADYCGKTITLKGKVSERGGIALLENAEVVKQ